MATFKMLALSAAAMAALAVAPPVSAADNTPMEIESTPRNWLPQDHRVLNGRVDITAGQTRDRMSDTTIWEWTPRLTIPGIGCSALAVALEVGAPARGPTPCATPVDMQRSYWDWIAMDIRAITSKRAWRAEPLTS